jgi:hypothetical protein
MIITLDWMLIRGRERRHPFRVGIFSSAGTGSAERCVVN